MKLNVASGLDTTVRLDTLDDDTGGGSVGGGDSSTEGAGDYELNNFEYSTNGGGTWLPATGAGLDEVTIPNGQTSILVRINTVEDATQTNDNAVEAFRLQIVAVTAGAATIAAGNAPDGGFAGTGEANIIDEDAPPVLDGGGSEDYSIPENTTFVVDANALDPDTSVLTYSIVADGSDDFNKLTIDPLTGVLSFIVAPNFEAPNDIGGDNNDNVYEFEIQVTDGQSTDVQDIAVERSPT